MAANDSQPSAPGTSAPNAATLVAVAERLGRASREAGAAIAARRGMALSLAGGFVVALAWVGERDSAWGFPMLIVGALMIGLGLLGPRLSGSFSLRWGEDGTFLELSSTIAPPGRRRRAPTLTSGSGPGDAEPGADDLVPPGEIVGEAETIEFKVEALGPDRSAPNATGEQVEG